MRAIRTAILTLLLTAAAPAAPAAAAEGPAGSGCVSVTMTDPVDGSRDTGVLAGGPLAGTGTLTCSLQYGDGHGAPDLFTATATGTDAVVVPPHRVSYAGYDVYTCTAFTPAGGQTLYLTRDWDGGVLWSTDPASSCAVGNEVEPLLRSVKDLVDCFECPYDLDILVCSVLPMLAPGLPPAVTIEPGGDVYVAGDFFWDCPPYVDWGTGPERPGDPVEALVAIAGWVGDAFAQCEAGQCDVGTSTVAPSAWR